MKYLQAFPKDDRVGCKCLTVSNTLAYCGEELITAVKCFVEQADRLSSRKLENCLS